MKKLTKRQIIENRQKSKKQKKIFVWSFIFLVLVILGYWSYMSSKNVRVFVNPIVRADQVPSGEIHWHPKLSIIIDGKKMDVSNSIGITPTKHSTTHTHDEGDGTIHIENPNPKLNPETMSLGYFFNQWGKSFNKTCILDKCTNIDGGEIHMYVNDKENFDFENYIFKGDDNIVIEYISENN